jgi:hypothetical protein
MVEHDDDVREARLRRVAERQGLTLLKSPQRDPQEINYQTYMLVEIDTETVKVSGSPAGYGLTLDDVEDVLAR